MKRLGFFVAGFASGWLVRSTVDSSRGLTVGAVAAVYGTIERLRRLVAIEREHLEDIVAEGKAKHESERTKAKSGENRERTDRAATSVRAAEIPRPGRAA